MVMGPDYQMRKYTLPIILILGLGGILIDLDHFIIAQTQMARPLHLPVFIIVWTVSISYYAYHHRRVHQSGIKKE
jgi:hypothetical protein